MQLSDRQQTTVRVVLDSDAREWQRLANEYKPWPYAEQRAKEARELVELFRAGEISVTTFEEKLKQEPVEVECDRCGYRDCACGDPEFEQQISIELRRAAEVE